jgi:NADPH:quinone reductase-like Zn-dependent oxidoreductase
MAENIRYIVRAKGLPLEANSSGRPTIANPTEVVIRLKAIALNPADYKMASQGHRVTSWPLVPGMDGAGIVEAVGSGVEKFAVGDEVLALFTPGDRGASYQNFAVVPESNVAKKPSTWSFAEAATLAYVFFLSSSLRLFPRCLWMVNSVSLV